MPVADLATAAALRPFAGVSACVVGDDLWLRADDAPEPLARALTRLAPAARFAVLPDGSLIPLGRSLPQGRLPPDASWSPLADLTRPRLASAALPAAGAVPVALTLVRTSGDAPATVLVTPLTALAAYADSAPAVRLERLRFAADAARAVVWGDPLPPLPGDRYTERAGVAAPCGFDWRPRIDPPSLRRLIGLAEGDLALLDAAGAWQYVPAASFVRARRSAVRFTAGGANP
jgi:hypothetical protein